MRKMNIDLNETKTILKRNRLFRFLIKVSNSDENIINDLKNSLEQQKILKEVFETNNKNIFLVCLNI
jgi:hypothetical protein